MQSRYFQSGALHFMGWMMVMIDDLITHNNYLFGAGAALLIYSLWTMTSKPEFDSTKKTCQVCRLQPAQKLGKSSNGTSQWRCITCHELKNRQGFTKGRP